MYMFLKAEILRRRFRSAQNDSAGSALLVTIILMAVLMIAGLGFHGLIVNSIRLSRDSISAGKAYFHAEAGIEEALLRIESNLPGYEVDAEPGDSDGDSKNDFQFSIKSLSSSADGSVPCNFDSADQPWKTIALNESVTFPLFRDNGRGEEAAISHFQTNYQFPLWPVSLSGDSVDALSWKIFGLTLTGESTEAMSGYFQIAKNEMASFDETFTANFHQCAVGGTCIFYENYKISDFLVNHRNNYLALTNIVNIPASDDVNPDDYALSWLLEDDGEALVCDMIRIEADGAAFDISVNGDRYRQNLNAEVSLPDFLPMFDFALYRTKE